MTSGYMEPSYVDPDPIKNSPPAYPGQPQPGTDPGYGPGPSTYPNQPGPSTYPPYGVYQQQQPVYPQPPPPQGAWGEQQPPMYPPPAGPPMGYGYGPPPFQQQQQQQVVVIGGQGPMAAVPIVRVDSYVSHIILSCFVFWCCNWLFGLIAFVLAMIASSNAVNDPSGARSLGKASLGVSIAGIVVTVVIIAIVVGVVVGGTAQAVNNAVASYNDGSSSTCIYYYNFICYKSYTNEYTKSQCSAYLNGYYYNYACYYN